MREIGGASGAGDILYGWVAISLTCFPLNGNVGWVALCEMAPAKHLLFYRGEFLHVNADVEDFAVAGVDFFLFFFLDKKERKKSRFALPCTLALR